MRHGHGLMAINVGGFGRVRRRGLTAEYFACSYAGLRLFRQKVKRCHVNLLFVRQGVGLAQGADGSRHP